MAPNDSFFMLKLLERLEIQLKELKEKCDNVKRGLHSLSINLDKLEKENTSDLIQLKCQQHR